MSESNTSLQAAQHYFESSAVLAAHERLAIAKGVTLDPASPYTPDLVKLLIENIPELGARLVSGGWYLELGCGVGGGLLSLLQAYPLLTAVGVEIAPDLVAEAQ
jgi:tRNA G46 methylase TrmB